MTDRPLIVLSLEGFATAALGCYGSSWNATPAIDAMSGSGCVWDRWIGNSDDPLAVLRTLINSPSWTERRNSRGPVEMLTDSAAAASSASESCFDRIETIPNSIPGSPAIDMFDSQLGQLIAAAIDRISQSEPWSTIWLHSNYLTCCWDAPRDLVPVDELDEEVREPSDDPEWVAPPGEQPELLTPIAPVFDNIAPPEAQISEDSHPDLVTSHMRTYGCQIRLLDLLVEVLMDTLGDRQLHLVLMGVSGFRLGQGNWVGHGVGPLRSPDIQLPLIVSRTGPLRNPHLVSTEQIASVLGELGSAETASVDPIGWRDTDEAARVETESQRAAYALTTPSWFFVRDKDESEHLFLKPDDLSDFNDVGRLRGDVIRQLLAQKNSPTRQ